MYPNQTIGRPHLGPEYVPYFYASGRFISYDLPHAGAREARFAPTGSYDFTSDLIQTRAYPAGQTVDQVIQRGYLAIPKSEPETAIISDKKHTSRLGLDDVIGQIRRRYEVYDRNIYEIEQGKCYLISSAYAIESARGGVTLNSKEMYGLNYPLILIFYRHL